MSWLLRQFPAWPTLDSLFADLRYGIRGLQRSPGFATVAVLMLALGIGINAAIFSVFAHVLLAPLQFSDPENLYVVRSHAASLGDAPRVPSPRDKSVTPRSSGGAEHRMRSTSRAFRRSGP